MSYKNMFVEDNPVAVASKSNLFGETKKENTVLRDIEAWKTSKPGMITKATRIEFILNGVNASSVRATQINDIGQHNIGEATMANNSIENVVTEFAELKPHLEAPKASLLSVTGLIDGNTKAKGFFSFLRASEPIDSGRLRVEVKAHLDNALMLMKNCVQYRLNPFISGLDDARYCINCIRVDLDDAINTLDYLAERATDVLLKDLAIRRKEMFAKSLILMNLNIGQVDSMTAVCEKNKAFLAELEMNVLPVMENVLRSAIIDDVNRVRLNDISNKLKGLL